MRRKGEIKLVFDNESVLPFPIIIISCATGSKLGHRSLFGLDLETKQTEERQGWGEMRAS